MGVLGSSFCSTQLRIGGFRVPFELATPGCEGGGGNKSLKALMRVVGPDGESTEGMIYAQAVEDEVSRQTTTPNSFVHSACDLMKLDACVNTPSELHRHTCSLTVYVKSNSELFNDSPHLAAGHCSACAVEKGKAARRAKAVCVFIKALSPAPRAHEAVDTSAAGSGQARQQ
jgi:hypothetical protein